jgi:hypothetical protein
VPSNGFRFARCLGAAAGILLAGGELLAQATATAAPTAAVAPTPSILTTPASHSIVAASEATLRAEIAELKRSEDRLLSTVLWSLGTCAGVTLLLVGYGWLVNFRISDREKLALRSELHNEITREVASAIAAIRQDVTQVVAERFEAEAKKMQANFEYLKEGVYLTMYFKMAEALGQEMKQKQFDSALTSVDVALGFAIDLAKNDFIEFCLDKLHEILRQKVQPTAKLLSNLTETLSELPERYGSDKNALTNKLAALRTNAASGTQE